MAPADANGIGPFASRLQDIVALRQIERHWYLESAADFRLDARKANRGGSDEAVGIEPVEH